MYKSLLKTLDSSDARLVVLERTRTSQPNVHNCHVGDHSLEVVLEQTGPHSGLLKHHGRIIPFAVMTRDDLVQVWMNGVVYTFSRVARAARRTSDTQIELATDELRAPMPGTVLHVHVRERDIVEARQPLVVMESMKMEMTLTASRATRIAKVLCRAGDLVEMQALLVAFEECETS